MYRRNASYAVSAAAWLLGSGLVAAACGGTAFSGDGDETGGGNAHAGAMAGKSNASGGASALAGGSTGSQGGNAAGAPDGGEPASSNAGAAGAGGGADALDCSALNGSTFAEILCDPLYRNLYNDPRWLPFLKSINKTPEQLAKIAFNPPLPKQST